MGSTDLNDLAQEYLEVCHLALADTPGGQIARRFVNAGVPAWDCCPQLSVHVGAAIQADTSPVAPALQTGHRAQTTGVVNMTLLTATVLRCVPVVQEGPKWPTPLQLDQAAAQTNADLWAIWSRLVHGKRTDVIFLPREREMSLEPAVSVNPQGGCGGWQIPVRIQLNGYQPTL